MTAAHRLRLALQRVGADVSRFPDGRPEHHRALALRHHDIATVLDVGANRGQYGSALRRFGYSRRIVSFEPLSEPFAVLRTRASRDPGWECFQYALGEKTSRLSLNVAGNDGASSSALPMLDAHRSAAPRASYVGVEHVEQRRLDDVLTDLALPLTERVFLKVDVQGYERHVLTGLGSAWDRIHGLQLELSLVPLYEGQMLYQEALDAVTSRGFSLQGLEPGFTDRSTGQLLQADGVFFRSTS